MQKGYTNDERAELKMARICVRDANTSFKEKKAAAEMIRRIESLVAERVKKEEESKSAKKPRARRQPDEEARIATFLEFLESEQAQTLALEAPTEA